MNKGTLVLLVASWEAYAEDLAEVSFNFMLKNATKPDSFPTTVLTEASKPLKTADDDRRVWELAGEGWKSVLHAHKDALIKKHVGKMNTPKPTQIDNLFESLIGLKGLSKKWKWHGISNKKALEQLEKLVETRGEVAHRVSASSYVTKKYVEQMQIFIQRIACISSNRIRDHILTHTNKEPWPAVAYLATK